MKYSFMKRRVLPLLGLLSVVLLGACATKGPIHVNPVKTSFDVTFAQFEKRANIVEWPHLDGCQYSTTFQGKIVGLLISIDHRGTAYGQWDGRCKVPIRHTIVNWPQSLSAGTYVVAATSATEPKNGWIDYWNRELKIIETLGRVPISDDNHAFVVERICKNHPVNSGRDRRC